jgi:peptide/nickel transport system substrate-binding protein
LHTSKELPRSLRASVLAATTAICFAMPSLAIAQAAKPQYGGKLEIGTIYGSISALSWDTADWNWKQNHDMGGMYEQLFAADLGKATRNGGKYPFYADAYLPADAIRGELAESWRWADPLRLEVKLRKGVMFPEKAGVMKARELTADDVVFTYSRLNASPKKIAGYFDHIEKVEAVDKHTVAFRFKEYNAEWDYRFGWGYYSGIVPKEVVDAGASNWRNATGSGPFSITEFVQGNSQTYTRNASYWDRERIAGTDYKLPFVDQVSYRIIKDEAAQLTALRTAKLDILETIRWSHVDELKKSAPKLQWARSLAVTGSFLAMRTDTKPFDDVRVRRALNMAVNKQEIIKGFYGGNAEMLAYPQHPDFGSHYEPLSTMPASVKELFTYDPEKAKKLLAEAGYPKGFTFKAQVSSANADHMELLPLVAAYLERIGVKMEIQPLEYPAFLSAMGTKTHAAGFFMDSGHTNPTTTLRKNFVSGQYWNASVLKDPDIDSRIQSMYQQRDDFKREVLVKQLTRDMLDKAPYIWLPTPYVYRAWWPWVKNYGGEVRAGSVRPWPIYSRIWVDQAQKKSLGF